MNTNAAVAAIGARIRGSTTVVNPRSGDAPIVPAASGSSGFKRDMVGYSDSTASGNATNTYASTTAARPGLQDAGSLRKPSHTNALDRPEVRDSSTDQVNDTITSDNDSDASTSTRNGTCRLRGRRASRYVNGTPTTRQMSVAASASATEIPRRSRWNGSRARW